MSLLRETSRKPCSCLGPGSNKEDPEGSRKASWDRLGPSQGQLGMILNHLRLSWVRLGSILGRLGAGLGNLEIVLGHPAAVLGHLGPSWTRLGAILWKILGHLGLFNNEVVILTSISCPFGVQNWTKNLKFSVPFLGPSFDAFGRCFGIQNGSRNRA